MKKMHLFLCLAALVVRADSATITVTTNQLSTAPFLGFGVQWSPYPWFDITDAAWEKVFERLDYMKVPMVRVMTRAYKYCDGFDASGNPIYQWENNRMKKLYRLLDYCEKRKVMVMIGEWDDPASDEDRQDPASDKLQPYEIEEDNPRWARLIGDFLDHLIKDKKYTCLKYYNLINEPNGKWSACADFGKWKTGIKNLHAELSKRGLLGKIQIIGPDATGQKSYYWLDLAVIEANKQLAAYDLHEYALPSDVESGWLEKLFYAKRLFINRFDVNGGPKKPFIMGEVGMGNRGPVEPQGGEDSHPKIYDHIYGVWMTDYNIQCVRAGMQGTIAWMLDDAMHVIKDKHSAWPDVKKTLFKKWGFFNSLANEIGHPEDNNLRPWYYTWSLMSRCFPRGAQILASTDPNLPGVRSLAGRIANTDYSFVLVNDSDQPQDIHLAMPSLSERLSLHRYNYFPNDRPTNKDGYPVIKETLTGVSPATGLDLNLPARSVIILTTLPPAADRR